MKIKFTKLSDGSEEEYAYLEERERSLDHDATDSLIKLLRETERDTGYPVSTLTHSLQTATRALRDGASDELVVAALLHDVGDVISPVNHAKVSAEILKPYVSEATYWIVAHHAVFQGFYFWHHIGKNQNAREQYRDSPYFDQCVEFCEKYDQVSFDPDYDTMPIESFIPIVRRVLSRTPFEH